jgi:hypothetical protein
MGSGTAGGSLNPTPAFTLTECVTLTLTLPFSRKPRKAAGLNPVGDIPFPTSCRANSNPDVDTLCRAICNVYIPSLYIQFPQLKDLGADPKVDSREVKSGVGLDPVDIPKVTCF